MAPQPLQQWLSRIPLLSNMLGRRSWVWDPDHFEISYAGVNAYWGIREDIGCMERRYSVDFDSQRYASYLAEIRQRIEIWELLLRKIAAVGRSRGNPTERIFSTMPSRR